MTPTQIDLAIEYIRARGFQMTDSTTDDQLEAMSFVFDNGVLMHGDEFAEEVIKMLEQNKLHQCTDGCHC